MVSGTDVKTAPLNCDGLTTTFPFTFPILSEADLNVYLIDAAGEKTLLTITTHYSVSAVNDDFSAGGNVETVATYDEGDYILIVRDAVNDQQSDYRHADDLPADTLENDLDRRTMVDQEQDAYIARALRFPIEDDDSLSGELPPAADRKGKFIRFSPDTGEPELIHAITPDAAVVTDFMETLLDDENAATARATIGAVDATYTLAGLGEKNISSLVNNLAALAPGEADEFPFWDYSGGLWKKVTRSNLVIPPYVVNIGTGDWPYTASLTRHWTNFYGTSGASDRVFDLPPATGSGKVAGIFKPDSGAGDIDVTPDGTDNINGLNEIWKINAQFQYVVLQDRAAGEWHVLDRLGTLLEFTSAANVAIGSPQSATWYNPTGHSLSLTPGLLWRTKYKITVDAADLTSASILVKATLSTTNNSESDIEWSSGNYWRNDHASTTVYLFNTFFMEKSLTVPVADIYYLNILSTSGGGGGLSTLRTQGASVGGTLISARRIA